VLNASTPCSDTTISFTVSSSVLQWFLLLPGHQLYRVLQGAFLFFHPFSLFSRAQEPDDPLFFVFDFFLSGLKAFLCKIKFSKNPVRLSKISRRKKNAAARAIKGPISLNPGFTGISSQIAPRSGPLFSTLSFPRVFQGFFHRDFRGRYFPENRGRH